ncbi:MAG: hypothetical protein K9W44_10380 [Candidatus Lokiarchaeota archaeon]|nr:hypothetical protein [Candidatus Harpocratesius repetitus]
MSKTKKKILLNRDLIPKILQHIENAGIIDLERIVIDFDITQNLLNMILEDLIKENLIETIDDIKTNCNLNLKCSHCPFAKNCGNTIKKRYLLKKSSVDLINY